MSQVPTTYFNIFQKYIKGCHKFIVPIFIFLLYLNKRPIDLCFPLNHIKSTHSYNQLMSNVNDLVDMILIKINQSWWLCNIVIYFYTTGSMAEKKVQASIHWFYNNVTIGTKRTEGRQLFFPMTAWGLV